MNADKSTIRTNCTCKLRKAAVRRISLNKYDWEEKNRDMDWYLYKIRHLVENAFARLKHYRAIATRYDKLKRNYLSTVLLGCIMVWLPL